MEKIKITVPENIGQTFYFREGQPNDVLGHVMHAAGIYTAALDPYNSELQDYSAQRIITDEEEAVELLGEKIASYGYPFEAVMDWIEATINLNDAVEGEDKLRDVFDSFVGMFPEAFEVTEL